MAPYRRARSLASPVFPSLSFSIHLSLSLRLCCCTTVRCLLRATPELRPEPVMKAGRPAAPGIERR